MSARPTQVKFTVENFYQMIENGILPENHREEIIEGILYEMPPSTPRHAAIHSKLGEIFHRRDDHIFSGVFTNRPITIDEYNEPIPDFCFSNNNKQNFRERHPKADEIVLVMEISDETLDFDLDFKIPLYAAAEIPEVWLVNLFDERIEIYSKPDRKMYNSRKDFQHGELIQSKFLPILKVDEILF